MNIYEKRGVWSIFLTGDKWRVAIGNQPWVTKVGI